MTLRCGERFSLKFPLSKQMVQINYRLACYPIAASCEGILSMLGSK